MNPTRPETVARSGFKYWLEPDGTLYQTDEHAVGARRWAMQNLDNAPITFGVSDLMRRGWVRLVTVKDKIWVTGGEDASSPTLTPAQKKAIRGLKDRFLTLNGAPPSVEIGDGITSKGVLATDDVARPEAVVRAEVEKVPSFYKDRRRTFGDSTRRFIKALFG